MRLQSQALPRETLLDGALGEDGCHDVPPGSARPDPVLRPHPSPTSVHGTGSGPYPLDPLTSTIIEETPDDAACCFNSMVQQLTLLENHMPEVPNKLIHILNHK